MPWPIKTLLHGISWLAFCLECLALLLKTLFGLGYSHGWNLASLTVVLHLLFAAVPVFLFIRMQRSSTHSRYLIHIVMALSSLALSEVILLWQMMPNEGTAIALQAVIVTSMFVSPGPPRHELRDWLRRP